MPEQSSFDYAVIRVVPQPEREEFVNAGVVLYCAAQRFLDCRIQLCESRVLALAPNVDLNMVRAQLDLFPRICQGGKEAGPLGELTMPERFRWLTSPRSTGIQISPVHSGLCDDPRAALDDLFDKLVAC